MDRKRQKGTDTDQNKQKRTEAKSYGHKWIETAIDRNIPKKTQMDRSSQNGTETGRNKQKQAKQTEKDNNLHKCM